MFITMASYLSNLAPPSCCKRTIISTIRSQYKVLGVGFRNRAVDAKTVQVSSLVYSNLLCIASKV